MKVERFNTKENSDPYSCMNFKSATTMLDYQKKLTKDDIKPILPKFYKENDTWKVLFPGDDGYEDH